MGKLDEAATQAATWMSISFGSSARDIAGAIGRPAIRRTRGATRAATWMAAERG